MDRRTFILSSAASAALACMPPGSMAAITGLSREEIESRVESLLSEMTLREKIDQMHGVVRPLHMLRRLLDPNYADTWDTPTNERLGVPPLRCVDGPRGVGTGHTTCFPVGMARGATFDPELEERIGDVMGYEARAKSVNVVLSPCINLLWHPAWGRAQETYGEDPVALGLMGAAHVRGLQKHVMACPKHFAVNNIENSRFFVNAVVDERTLREVYLPHFKTCVEAGAASVMSAYNDLNGELCAHNEHLLRDILKGDWEFSGFVVSDWIMAVEDTVEAALGGLDVEMPTGAHFGRALNKAVEAGTVPLEVIDDSVRRVLRMKLSFIPEGDPSRGYERDRIGGPEHTGLALECERKAMVLLKNEDGVLPFDRAEMKTLAVIGKLADRRNLGDQGSSAVNPAYAVTPLQGLKDLLGDSVKVVHDSGSSPRRAARTAASADAAVVVAGLTWRDEGEYIPQVNLGGDRDKLTLHADDEELIRAVAGANPKTAVVLEAGSALVVESWKDHAPAILMAWYPGMEGGTAIAEALFGLVNPSGKLPIVFPKSQDQLYEFDNEAKIVEYGYLHGQRWFDEKGIEPAWPFGFGLSYTAFEFSNLKAAKPGFRRRGRVRAAVDVTNTGGRAGETVAQLYVSFPGSEVKRPKKALAAFARVSLDPGETKTVELSFPAAGLAYYDVESGGWVMEELEYRMMAGGSAAEADLVLTF